MAIKKASFVGDQSADNDFRATDPSVQPDEAMIFNDQHDRNKYNADVTASIRRVGRVISALKRNR